MKEEIEKEIENRLRKLGVKTIECRKCKKEMFWLTTKGDKRMPVTMALISHFADCPHAKDFRKE